MRDLYLGYSFIEDWLMFDELSYNLKYFEEELLKAEAYLEPKGISAMERFCKYT